MYNIVFYSETFSNGYIGKSLVIIDIISIIASLLVITSKNPIISVLFLISLFLGVSCHLIVIGFNFIGLSYLLVYVGAISILFLFILMLINIRISELLNKTSNVVPLILIFGLFSFFFNYDYTYFFYNTIFNEYNNILQEFLNKSNKDQIFFTSSKLWDGTLGETIHISSIGDILYTNYSIWLILTSIILLLAMVGSIIITIKQPE